MVKFEDSWGLVNQDFDYFCQAREIIIIFVVIYNFQKNLSKEESVFIGLCLTNEVALIAKTAF